LQYNVYLYLQLVQNRQKVRQYNVIAVLMLIYRHLQPGHIHSRWYMYDGNPWCSFNSLL